MAYEVTATRRRPQKFEDLIGQEFVAETFKNSIQSNKIAHAYLFSGPRGCGKTSTARILAKSLNCENGPTAAPCGKCAACKEITAGSCLDVIEIDGASNTSVNDVRQIKDEVLFPPNSCRYKIYIIDEVHMLSNSAFNALLKTIEEPPPYAIFIFATTELQKVPATIKSRCQQFNFRLIPIEKVKEQLALAAEEIGIKAEDEALYWIAREATGSMRDSYTLFDQVAAFSDGEITFEKIRDKLGLVGVDRLNELFGLCTKGESTQALLKIDEYLQNGVSIEQLISNCTDYLRSLLLIKNGVKKEALLGQSAERFSPEVLAAWNNIQIERAVSIFLNLYRDIRYSISPRYEFELAVSRLCWLREYVSPAEVKRAIDLVKPLLDEAAYPRKITASLNEQKGPFPEGGAEPPYQTEELNEQQEGEQWSNVTEEEKAFIDKEINGNLTEYIFAGRSFSSQSGDTNQSEPKTTEQNNQTENSTAEVLPKENAFPKQIELSDLNKVKETISADFFDSEPMIANALLQTFNWKLEGEKLTVCTEGSYQKMQLAHSAPKINEYLSKLFGRRIYFSVELVVKQTETVKEKLPVQVEILRETFKGSVLGMN